MSDDASPRLGLPYVAAGQAQKHLTVNEVTAFLDGLTAAAAESRSVAAQPADPADGVAYLLPAGASGAAWSLLPAGALARFEAGAWAALPSVVGQVLLVRDEDRLLVHGPSGWTGLGAYVSSLADATAVGIGATADAYNPLLVRGPGALFTADASSFQVKINKAGPGDTASVLYQDAYGGRAELGLCGDDKLHLKTSPDGATWTEAWVVDGAGRTGFGTTAPTSRVQVEGALRVKSYSKAALPSASGEGSGAIIHVYDDSAGSTLAFSDGGSWRRVHDRAAVA